MAPTNSSPTHKVVQPQRTDSQDSVGDGIRKRVCKACDRCRLKKSKCDGSHPCTRCKADNAICVFGERKKSHDKVYPKGYVEMLEQQQSQLVSGLQEMYRRLRAGQQWDGATLSEANGYPLTHDILAALNLLETKHDGSQEIEAFEEDVTKLQSRLLAEGAGFAHQHHRRGSVSSESEQSTSHTHENVRTGSYSTPIMHPPAPVFRDSFHFSAPSSPLPKSSPIVSQRPSFPPQQPSHLSHSSALSNDPQFYQAEWAFPDMSSSSSNTHNNNGSNNENLTAEKLIRARYAMQAAQLEQQMSLAGGLAEIEHQQHLNHLQQQQQQQWDQSNPSSAMPYDMNMLGMGTWPAQQLMTAFATTVPLATTVPRATQDAGVGGMPSELEQMDIDLNQYIQTVT